MSIAIAMALRPFVALLVLLVFCAPAVYAVRRWMPDGKFKRLLLRPIGGKQPGRY